ncbi:hypothetical protein JRO89_XS07G0274300 [Xanthoceras sorbifolium]|uniref:MLO-like protein n=1 Tax=Xanthoceras sorbifolium TaxID=99658 RepID=A0ABQ8HVG7_9ROSI|nr:hypothetical protein JRO89_XS07G0274300 [Xanthoceras sorbifolium]
MRCFWHVYAELMLVGFMSLLLTALQDTLAKICISRDLATKWLPCKLEEKDKLLSVTEASRFADGNYCASKGKVPLLSTIAFSDLDMFLFVLAVTHVGFTAILIFLGQAKIRQWKDWESSIVMKEYNRQAGDVGRFRHTSNQFDLGFRFMHVQEHDFIKNHFRGVGKINTLLDWLRSFFKQFYGNVSKSDYTILRRGFIMTHCSSAINYNFHRYVMLAFQEDFKKVVGISGYLWLLAAILLLSNVYGWHAYFWISFIPFILLIAVGAKLEHIITQLAYDIVEKYAVVTEDVVVTLSDDHFWFQKPQIILKLIHFILFQNSFELSFFFCIWVQYGFHSCLLGHVGFLIPRLIMGLSVQLLCSYSILPLYAIVTQMRHSFNKAALFDEGVTKGLHRWAHRSKKARKQAVLRNDSHVNGSNEEEYSNVNGSSEEEDSHVNGSIEEEDSQEAESAMEDDNIIAGVDHDQIVPEIV